MTAPAPAGARARFTSPDAMLGWVVEVRDLTATRAFYEQVFRQAGGRWVAAGRGRLAYRCGAERVEFGARARPRTLPETGQHQAYRVPADDVPRLVSDLAAAGYAAALWREDRPAERAPTAYLSDPSGNRVQLVAADADAGLVDHATLEVHDLELAETFYVRALGGTVDYYHGWTMEDYAEARAWGEGRDPCAPWTRRTDVQYWNKRQIPRPNMQLFVRFGSGVLGLVLAREHRQEPPEESLRGTPRVVLGSPGAAADARAALAARDVPSEVVGRSVFLRDPGGNYVELECEAP
jgi:predicted enzyme related to lactoylglutathione lyase